jgi:hypothetical protein
MLSNVHTAVKALVERRVKNQADQEVLKLDLKDIDTQICEIVKPEEIIKAKGKEYGEVTTEDYGAKLTVGSDKKVKWDSDMLMAIAGTIPWQQAVAMFKISFEMSETKYKALVDNVAAGIQPQELLDRVNEARTVEITEAKLKKAELSTPK